MKDQEQTLQALDLREITRKRSEWGDGFSKASATTITIHLGDLGGLPFTWILAGECHIRNENPNFVSIHARMDDTDEEHDSAYAFMIPLIGLRFDHMWNQATNFTAWIDPNNPDDFRVPPVHYYPRTHPKAKPCPQCKGDAAHMIVPFYRPPVNNELFQQVAGKRIEINIR